MGCSHATQIPPVPGPYPVLRLVKPPLLDHLICPQQERPRDLQAEGLGGLEIDDQLVLGGLLDGQVRRLSALEDLVNEHRGTLEQIWVVRAVTHESTSLGILLRPADTGQAVCEGKITEPLVTGKKSRALHHDDRSGAVALYGHERGIVVSGIGTHGDTLQTDSQ